MTPRARRTNAKRGTQRRNRGRVRDTPSPPVYEIGMREAWIPMRDGVRLAADLYVPVTAGQHAREGDSGQAFPVLLEYLPYRKTESRARCYALYSYFVRRGYVVARVDIRGTGNSEGRLVEWEYSEQEQQDGEDVIAWLAAQPFSSGKVGMFGISWGGFNSIHMAMRNPPALRAILAVEAADDLYEDDVHFVDGNMHVDSYELQMDVENAKPGAPDYVIDEAYFRDRFDAPPWLPLYKRHQRDGPFWDRTAPKAHFDAIRIPTFLIGGFYDGYRDSVPRMLERVKAPVKAIVGPWAHAFPHHAYPKPQIEWRHEAVRWFDHWLRGKDTGMLEEPRFAVYMRRSYAPRSDLPEIPGEWRWEDGWPVAHERFRTLYPRSDHVLAPRLSAAAKRRAVAHRLRYVPTSGMETGGPVMWWGDLPPDQRPADALSLVYDSAPVEEEVAILGMPRAVLRVAADARLARWFARLSDVAPDGSVTLVAGAGFNGTHRTSSRRPEAFDPRTPVTLTIDMHFASWVFEKGHRIRLAVGNSQWPMFWPTPDPMNTTLFLGGAVASKLILPLVLGGKRRAPRFLPPEPDWSLGGFQALDAGTNSGYAEIASIQRDELRRATKIVARNASGMVYPWGTERTTESITHETQDEHPDATSVLGDYTTSVELPGRILRWEGRLTFRSDRENFHYAFARRLLKDGALVRERQWEETIPRDFQ